MQRPTSLSRRIGFKASVLFDRPLPAIEFDRTDNRIAPGDVGADQADGQ